MRQTEKENNETVSVREEQRKCLRTSDEDETEKKSKKLEERRDT